MTRRLFEGGVESNKYGNFTAVREALEQEGQLAESWYCDNFLLVNPDKFQAMILKANTLI